MLTRVDDLHLFLDHLKKRHESTYQIPRCERDRVRFFRPQLLL